MCRRVRPGRVAGAEVAAEWSWVFTFVRAAWALTLITVGGGLLPALSTAMVTLLSVAAAIGLFASLALHEVAPGLAARACGVPVRELTHVKGG